MSATTTAHAPPAASPTTTTTTTTTPHRQPSTRPQSLTALLADYEIHYSPAPPPSAEHDAPELPPSWPSDHRRVPAHRAVNAQLDQSRRRVYSSGGERAFLLVMFAGVRANAAIGRIWRETGGKINDRIFRYKIGGEW